MVSCPSGVFCAVASRPRPVISIPTMSQRNPHRSISLPPLAAAAANTGACSAPYPPARARHIFPVMQAHVTEDQEPFPGIGTTLMIEYVSPMPTAGISPIGETEIPARLPIQPQCRSTTAEVGGQIGGKVLHIRLPGGGDDLGG